MNISNTRSVGGYFSRLRTGVLVTAITLSMGAMLFSCKQPTEVVTPRFQGLYTPKAVQMILGSRTAGTKVDFAIDNVNMRIFNQTPLPYGTKLDSAYLVMYLTNQVPMSLVNEATGAQKWHPGDTVKISVKGGKLKLNISRDGHPALTYDMRIQSYGYDPNKLTWESLGDKLPVAAEQARVMSCLDTDFYVGRVGDKASLYYFSTKTFHFTPMESVTFPKTARPTTLFQDKHGKVWIVDDAGTLYSSDDFINWYPYYTPGTNGKEEIISILGDNSKAVDKYANLAVMTKEKNEEMDKDLYFFKRIQNEESGKFKAFGESAPVPADFPIADSYIYTYDESGTAQSKLFGGTAVDGSKLEKSYFSSDGLAWAENPKAHIKGSVPKFGGLFLESKNDPGRLMLIGGVYGGDPKTKENEPSNKIKVSIDRGLTWTELKEDQMPPATFVPRYNASGFLVRDAKGIEHVYIMGGIVSGEASKEVWHGYLDTTGGVVNAYEK